MNNNILKCDECGENLRLSQYAHRKLEGQAVEQPLVCRNYPKCPRAEKEI